MDKEISKTTFLFMDALADVIVAQDKIKSGLNEMYPSEEDDLGITLYLEQFYKKIEDLKDQIYRCIGLSMENDITDSTKI